MLRGLTLSSFSGVVGALVGGVAEYIVTGGLSGWVPTISAVCGAIFGLLWGVYLSPNEPNSDITVHQLIARTKNLTEIEAKAKARQYRGLWLQVSGEVKNVRQVIPPIISVLITVDDTMVIATFGLSWKSRVRALSTKDRVTIVGKVSNVSSFVTLNRAKLIRVLPPHQELPSTSTPSA